MSKKDAIAKIRKLFLEDFKKITKRAERIQFLKTLIDQADERDLESYALFFRGCQKWLEKDFAPAIECFEKAIVLDDKLAYPWYGLGNVYDAKKDYDKAMEAYNKAIALDDKYANPWYGLGIVYHNKKDYDKAIEAYNKAIALDDKYANPWYGLGIVYYEKKDYDKAIEAFNKAIALDDKDANPWYELGNVYRNKKDYDKAMEAYNKAIALDDKYAYPWYGLGTVYSDKKDYDKAIEAFNKAIALDDKFAYPWYGLGIVYSDKKDYDKAIEAFNKAIALDDKFAYPWHGLGNVYYEKKDYDKAIEAYNKSIALDDKFAYPWNGLGNVYAAKKDYDKAIEAYNKSIALDDKFAHAYRNLALCFSNAKKYEEAEKNFKMALSLFNEKGDHYFVSLTESNIEDTLNLIKSDDALKTKKKESSRDPIYKVLKETIDKKIEEKALRYQNTFLEFICEKKDDARDDCYFQVLRRWNSYTPIIADNYHISKGGGYFVKTATKGIVIDPGFNFIDNFKGANHYFYEIDAVLLTHAHNDHTADLESILTLLFKYNEVVKGLDDLSNDKTILAEIAKRKNSSPINISQKEVEDEFLKSPRRKTLDIYLTSSVFKKYSGMLNLFSSNDYRIHVIENGNSFEIDRVKIEVVGAKHYDIISDRDSVGFALAFENTLLVYTGDTGWNEDIDKQYKDLAGRYKDHTRLLVAHLGGFKEYEKFYMDESTRSQSFYKNHLGRIGLAKINEALRPKVCFISEFGEELKHSRIELAEIFQEAFENKITFIPADIGLKYSIDKNKVEAITGIDVDEDRLSYGNVEPADVLVCLLRKDFSLHYYKRIHALKESDLIQMLSNEFDKSTTK